MQRAVLSAKTGKCEIVDLTAAELAEVAAREAEEQAQAAVREAENTRQGILDGLAALDQWLPRAVEDIIEAEDGLGMVSTEDVLTTYDKLSPENQARLGRKRALRAELAALEGGE